VNFSTACFRFRGQEVMEKEIEEMNERILARVNSSGEVYISQTRLRGTFALRLAIGNLRTDEEHVRRAWQLLREAQVG
jgi:aromatic-L-amino-acid/L-tryptophan decarboxylase